MEEFYKGVKEFNKFKGDAGETIASVYLEQNGFKIIEMNYRNKHGEIDIIATKEKGTPYSLSATRFAHKESSREQVAPFSHELVYHFVEVKMRATDKYGRGREAVDFPKQKRIRGAAQYYLIANGLHDAVYSCFDVVEISGWFDDYKLEFLENCF